MKDVIYLPYFSTPIDSILDLLRAERDIHSTTHVMGVEINELISTIEDGKSYRDAVSYLRRNSDNLSKEYLNEPLF